MPRAAEKKCRDVVRRVPILNPKTLELFKLFASTYLVCFEPILADADVHFERYA